MRDLGDNNLGGNKAKQFLQGCSQNYTVIILPFWIELVMQQQSLQQC